jgi:hypothetical protein
MTTKDMAARGNANSRLRAFGDAAAGTGEKRKSAAFVKGSESL